MDVCALMEDLLQSGNERHSKMCSMSHRHEGNPNLRPESKHSTGYKVILGASIGGLVIILVLFAVSIFFLCHFRTKVSHQKGDTDP